MIIVCPIPADALRENLPAAGIELGEDIVEQQQGWCGQQFRFRKQEGQHRKTLLALRPELAQITIAARDHNVVEVWADSRRTALEIACEPLLQRLPRRRLGIVREPRGAQPQLLGSLGERRPQRVERLTAAGYELCRRAPATCSVHGSSASRPETPSCTRRSAAFRCASAAR